MWVYEPVPLRVPPARVSLYIPTTRTVNNMMTTFAHNCHKWSWKTSWISTIGGVRYNGTKKNYHYYYIKSPFSPFQCAISPEGLWKKFLNLRAILWRDIFDGTIFATYRTLHGYINKKFNFQKTIFHFFFCKNLYNHEEFFILSKFWFFSNSNT